MSFQPVFLHVHLRQGTGKFPLSSVLAALPPGRPRTISINGQAWPGDGPINIHRNARFHDEHQLDDGFSRRLGRVLPRASPDRPGAELFRGVARDLVRAEGVIHAFQWAYRKRRRHHSESASEDDDDDNPGAASADAAFAETMTEKGGFVLGSGGTDPPGGRVNASGGTDTDGGRVRKNKNRVDSESIECAEPACSVVGQASGDVHNNGMIFIGEQRNFLNAPDIPISDVTVDDTKVDLADAPHEPEAPLAELDNIDYYYEPIEVPPAAAQAAVQAAASGRAPAAPTGAVPRAGGRVDVVNARHEKTSTSCPSKCDIL